MTNSTPPPPAEPGAPPGPSLAIAILDDEPKLGKILARVLSREGHRVASFTDPDEALAALASERRDLLLTDLKMPGASGIEVMARAKELDPDLDVVMMTAFASVETAIEAMKLGALDYLVKPFHNDELVLLAARVAERRGLREENRCLRDQLAPAFDPRGVVAASPAMREVLERARKVAATDVSVLLLGESGVGKEVLATLVQSSGPRARKPFVKVNCGALPETLLESELFGHVRGAFTGALETRKGLFQAADGGTIFLDEIGEISPALQVKLLRVLQSGEFQRVGDPQVVRVDVRVIAATNRPLEELVAAGRFRSDLYYRLNVVPIVIPPLRERREDVPALVDHFLARIRARGGRARRISREAFELLVRHDWPGNIRELENALEHAVVMCEGEEVGVEDLPTLVRTGTRAFAAAGAAPPAPLPGAREAFGFGGAGTGVAGSVSGGTVAPAERPGTLEAAERKMLHDALVATGFNHTRAAAMLGITRRTLGYRIEKYGLPRRAPDIAPREDSQLDSPRPNLPPPPEPRS